MRACLGSAKDNQDRGGHEGNKKRKSAQHDRLRGGNGRSSGRSAIPRVTGGQFPLPRSLLPHGRGFPRPGAGPAGTHRRKGQTRQAGVPRQLRRPGGCGPARQPQWRTDRATRGAIRKRPGRVSPGPPPGGGGNPALARHAGRDRPRAGRPARRRPRAGRGGPGAIQRQPGAGRRKAEGRDPRPGGGHTRARGPHSPTHAGNRRRLSG